MTLDEVPTRTPVRVSTLTMAPADHQRLTELGLRHGARVEVLRRAPFRGPLALRVADGGLLALRRVQAARIIVVEEDTRV
jgi:ferrous iron transport protein A